jgi:C-terminal processing protease CtpA/Prc
MSKKWLLLSLCLLMAVACASVALAQTRATAARAAQQQQEEGVRAFSMVVADGNFLGVYTETVTGENMSRYNLSGEPRGVVVTQVVENSPAARAGLQKGDVIVRFDGEAVTSTQKLSRLINESAPGHTARLTFARGGGEREATVTLGKRDLAAGARQGLMFKDGELFRWDDGQWKKQTEEEARKQREEWQKHSEEWKKQSEEWKKHSEELSKQLGRLQQQLPQGASPLVGQQLREQLEKMQVEGQRGNYLFALGAGRRIGVTTTQLTDQLADYFGTSRDGGVLVTSVVENSPAAKAGLKAGDVVTEVDGERVKNAGDLTRLVSRKEEGDVTLTVTRNRSRHTFKVTPEKSSAPTTWTMPEAFFPAHGAAFALPRGVVRPSIITAPQLRVMPALPAMPALPRVVVPTTPLRRARPVRIVVPASGQLMEL